ncbi:MAG TPA: SDR family NAD(P)-dependent oxidoreductase, partial [Gemmatimonadales bacterium]|nr:SDR family NAD(P)-dependent oxidoreductase [Gemmatimonadales bacterium]
GFAAAGQPADVGDPDQVRGLVATVTRELGPVGVLVNNAGIGIFRPFAELTLEDWDATMSTNLRGLYLVTREVLPGMRERKSGFIVNVASLAGKNPLADGTAYAASKHAVLGFTKSLLLEVRKQGVRVMAICPGSVHTAFRGQPRPNAASILQPEDVAASILAALMLPERALMSEIDLRPANP